MEEKCTRVDSCEYLNKFKGDLDGYQKCVENSLMELNNLNIKYEKTVREISSIFDLFQHINLITDYYNLRTIINDMLIGVLGVTSSTIFSVNENQLLVEASSISRQDLKQAEPIKKRLLDSGCLQGKLAVFNADAITEAISKSRNIKSAVSIPLLKNDKCMGVIYLEHIMAGYFKEEDKQLLNTLAIAVRLAIENAELYSSLENMALRDSLTGLYNQVYFNKEIQSCMDVYNKYTIPFILAVGDIDGLSSINQSYGHIFGDSVITQIGKMIENEIRKGDIVCRLEGDRFAIIFRNTSDINAIFDRLENIRKKIFVLPIFHEKDIIAVSCSFGFARFVDCDTAVDKNAVQDCVEQALKSAKKHGKNTVMAYENIQSSKL